MSMLPLSIASYCWDYCWDYCSRVSGADLVDVPAFNNTRVAAVLALTPPSEAAAAAGVGHPSYSTPLPWAASI